MEAVLQFLARVGLQPDAAAVALIAAAVALYFSTIGKDYLLHAFISGLAAFTITPLLVTHAQSLIAFGWSVEMYRAAVFAVVFALAHLSLTRSPFAYPLSAPHGYTRILWLIAVTGFLSACLFSLGAITATTPLVIKIFTESWSVPLWLGLAWILLIFFRNDD